MKVIIVGAGAAGLIAAGHAAETADKVILIDKNEYPGRKLLITGKGRCNLTNSAPIAEMFDMYPTNPKFLYSALYTFTNDDLVALVESMGTKTKVERGGRIFPVSDKAADILRALKKYARKENVTYINAAVTKLITEGKTIKGVIAGGKKINGDKVIICTGGKSYPNTGSAGEGYILAKSVGHTVIPPKPSLVPIVTRERWVSDCMGLSLKNINITAYYKNEKVFAEFGEMLFTHFGISGPVVLSMSAHLRDIEKHPYDIKIDLKPALDEQTLDRRIVRDFEKYSHKDYLNALGDLLPKKLIPVIVSLSGVTPHTKVCEIRKDERSEIVKIIKDLPLTAVAFRPVEEAIVTSGGVAVNEINPSTMESKIIKGLYFAGEVIDVDGYTGGFNLQAAFSTGYLAAGSAVLEEK